MLGTALIEVAVRECLDVYALIRPDTKRADRLISSPLVHVAYASLDNIQDIGNLPKDCDVFYHFAWAGTSKAERDDPQIQAKNIKYTLDAVELAEKTGCRRFIFAGSQAEYGAVDGVIDENTKYSPSISYGVAKYAAGILSRKLCNKKGITYIGGRVFSVYGPHDSEETMLSYLIKCCEIGDTAKLSSAAQSWNYLYEADAGEIFYRLGLEYVPTGTYFVANPKSEILRKYIELTIKEYGGSSKVEFASADSIKAPGLNVDLHRTLDVLKYKPQTSFEEGIKKMIQAKINNGSKGGGIA